MTGSLTPSELSLVARLLGQHEADLRRFLISERKRTRERQASDRLDHLRSETYVRELEREIAECEVALRKVRDMAQTNALPA